MECQVVATLATSLGRLSAGSSAIAAGWGAVLLEQVDVVVGNSHVAIELEGGDAEAPFYVLNVSSDARSAEHRARAGPLRRRRDDSSRR